MKYCVRCVLPESKPDLFIDSSGICSACRAFDAREDIDWDDRRSELDSIVHDQGFSSDQYDCVVPVSGGKDSFFQTWLILQMGLKPLCVTATTCDLTPIGRRNLDALRGLGVDLLEYSPNPVVRRRLNAIGLREVGDISWPEHLSIFTFPVTVALKFDIPWIFWGENPQNEYGGPAESQNALVLDEAWLDEFGGLLGLRIDDFCDSYGFARSDLVPYFYPDITRTTRPPKGLFLGHYLPWDGYSNVLLSQALGWESWPTRVEGHFVNYENLDNYQAGIHEYFKYLKFGFGRASDQLSLHIRRKRIDRDTAASLLPRLEGMFPYSYLGESLQAILARIGVSVSEFRHICDRFTNSRLFEQDGDTFKVDDDGNLIRRFAP